jgi:hypothetical protein
MAQQSSRSTKWWWNDGWQREARVRGSRATTIIARSPSFASSTNHLWLGWAEVESVETASNFRESESACKREHDYAARSKALMGMGNVQEERGTRPVKRSKANDDTRSRVSMPHAKPRHSNRWSTMANKWGAQIAARARRMIGVRRKEEEKWTSNEGRRVFISRESDGWDDARRLARNGRAKPQWATICLEARRSAPFIRTKIICINLKY